MYLIIGKYNILEYILLYIYIMISWFEKFMFKMMNLYVVYIFSWLIV